MTFQTSNMVLQIATIFYFSSMAGYLFYLFRQKDMFQKAAFVLTCAGVAAHLISICIYTASESHLPIQNLVQSLSLAAFSIGSMFIFFQYKFDLKILGVFASILVSMIMLAVWVLPDAPVEKNTALTGFWFYSHIILVFAGEAALAMACGAGILYLLQEKGIKSKTPGFFFKRLPSLDFLDNVGYTCLTIGFTMLTIGLVTGFIYAKAIWGRFWSWDPKEVFSVGSWLIYAVLLHLRLSSGWRGRKSAIMAIVGFFILAFTFLGVNMLLGGHHQEFTK